MGAPNVAGAAKILWRRLPTYFPNIKLAMYPIRGEEKKLLADRGWLRQVHRPCCSPAFEPGLEARMIVLGVHRPAAASDSSQDAPHARAQAVFRTTPEVGKLDIREFLEKVYELPVERVDTTVVQGKVKTVKTDPKGRKVVRTKQKDFKKVWVTFAPGRLVSKVPEP